MRASAERAEKLKKEPEGEMTNRRERVEVESGGGFVLGLVTGAVIGGGLAMLLASKFGKGWCEQVSEQAGDLAGQASEKVHRATEQAGEWAERGREMYNSTRAAVARGMEEARKDVSRARESLPNDDAEQRD
jgi:gas vesicle protein